MQALLYGYDVNAPTWAYLSALLVTAVYFRFARVFSSRNLDLVLLFSLAPGMLLTRSESTRTTGFVWLMVVTAALVVRALFDPWQKWRPRFDQNMNEAGMLFLGVCSLLFLGVRAATEPLADSTNETITRAEALIDREALPAANLPPVVSTDPVTPVDDGEPADASPAELPPSDPPSQAAIPQADLAAGPGAAVLAAPVNYLFDNVAPRALAILSHLLVVAGLFWAGRSTFDSSKTGVAMATLYTLLPGTAYEVTAVNHVLPAALTMWAFVLHRRPVAAGVLLGMAGATQVFPLFLVPVWASYYGRAGVKRFLLGFGVTLAAAAGSLVFVASDAESFFRLVLGSFYPYVQMLGGSPDAPALDAGGFWSGGATWSLYRLPVIVAYLLMAGLFAFAPRPKTLEMLLAQSVALILGTQFWVPGGGGLFFVWYLPLLLLMMFRPRLPDPFEVAEPTATVRVSEPAMPSRGGTVKSGTLR